MLAYPLTCNCTLPGFQTSDVLALFMRTTSLVLVVAQRATEELVALH